jgi:hypothetical protein
VSRESEASWSVVSRYVRHARSNVTIRSWSPCANTETDTSGPQFNKPLANKPSALWTFEPKTSGPKDLRPQSTVAKHAVMSCAAATIHYSISAMPSYL